MQSGKTVLQHTIKMYAGVEILLSLCLIEALDGRE